MRCKATRADGAPCRAESAKGKDYCLFHDPDKAELMTAARRAGNDANAQRIERDRPVAPAPAAAKPWRGLAKEVTTLETAEPVEVAVLIGDTIDGVRTGEISPQVANSIGYLAQILIKVFETVELEERLKTVEDHIRRQNL